MASARKRVRRDGSTAHQVEFAAAFDAALYMVSDAEVMLTRVLNTMSFSAYTTQLGHTHSEAQHWIDAVCREAIAVLRLPAR
ncbi:hypothetical protein R6V09_38370 [Streptomyces sp. W16]|uniref:hypothetical protein n=1 Tax=Streptomyces sp. W16 TaxID=3076631 RepID=UPI00295C1E56|nr:hypothetical protein [Streptomyces sp. W16]MDV9175973.1 hypothetical protein [Streptomyces sp. W16]